MAPWYLIVVAVIVAAGTVLGVTAITLRNINSEEIEDGGQD